MPLPACQHPTQHGVRVTHLESGCVEPSDSEGLCAGQFRVLAGARRRWLAAFFLWLTRHAMRGVGQQWAASEDGARFAALYKVTAFPFICIIDPRTSENVFTFERTKEATAFLGRGLCLPERVRHQFAGLSSPFRLCAATTFLEASPFGCAGPLAVRVRVQHGTVTPV